MKRLALLLCLAATAALAHQGVQNPAVMARMHAMKDIAGQMKLLGGMAKGATAFDASAAQAAAAVITQKAAATKDLFRAQEDDPKSEALPAIWADYADFEAKADALTQAAQAATTVATAEELAAAMSALGATCRDCHRAYRE
ncbi:Cytochrome c-556 [Candidatus Rhodobacter oscarellae]|uniref:Cytochrome c-556 n=1 Tax=Candidatus Rhodobacter oscarellae TaxID=1675527 RepID=A0A0J9E893_9RHOB|nr:cytochrome c [Candidatus Rhodobacter lobularis]KMW58960.1 Cytochrome c-556 [Candidatus Rhodobacter lobularis]